MNSQCRTLLQSNFAICILLARLHWVVIVTDSSRCIVFWTLCSVIFLHSVSIVISHLFYFRCCLINKGAVHVRSMAVAVRCVILHFWTFCNRQTQTKQLTLDEVCAHITRRLEGHKRETSDWCWYSNCPMYRCAACAHWATIRTCRPHTRSKLNNSFLLLSVHAAR